MSSAFPTTHWSIIQELSAGPDRAKVALETLCQQYREPLLKFLRASGVSRDDDADDLIQDFLAYFLEKDSFKRADQSRGRLRTFLITSLKNFASKQHAKRHAQKRGGGVANLPLTEASSVASKETNLEETFDRAWGETVMQAALERLESEYAKRDRSSFYQVILPFLESGADKAEYVDIARLLGVRPNRVALEVFRLRRRFREIIREEVGQTVMAQGDIEEELRYLARVLKDS